MQSQPLPEDFNICLKSIQRLRSQVWYGHISAVVGLLVEVIGISARVHIGSTVEIYTLNHGKLLGEIIGFRGNLSLVMAYGSLEGVAPGARVDVLGNGLYLYPTPDWKGRVLDGLGRPADGKGPLPQGALPYGVKASPPAAHDRLRVHDRIDLGIRVLNTFTTCCLGQRMGIFSGSGVGKSVLLGQIARLTNCDVAVIGLIGERGREVKEFLQDHLGEEGLKRAVMIEATSDMPALVRRQAAYITLTVAEYFRDQGLNVLCMIDSITRFAAAQREIGLSAGEPPTTRGYPPTVFAELPRLLERAGTGIDKGTITGLFTVLVEGDDLNEPIADAVRSILDGHIVLDRSIAEHGQYPAVNVLKSLSRTMPDCNTPEETQLITRSRQLLSVYEDMAEMIRLGAYRKGSSVEVDEAIRLYPTLMAFLAQEKQDCSTLLEGFEGLKRVLSS